MSNKHKWILWGGLGVFLASLVWAFIYKAEHGSYKVVTWDDRNQSVESMEAELKELAPQIRKVASNGACEYDSHCKIVGLGSKTCGQYKNYLIYSTADTDTSALLRLVEEFNSKKQELDKLALSVPNCGIAPKPVRCIKKRCQVGY